MPPVNIAVAGAGLIGRAHIKRILEEPEASLAAIIDPAPAARSLAKELDVSYFADLKQALDHARLDGIILATPNKMHVSGALEAISAKIPVLLEKPISDDLHSAGLLVDAAETAKVPILVGHHRRHSPLIKSAKALIESGRLGRLTIVNGLCWFRKPDTDYFDGSGAWRREIGGGPVLINLIHVIDDLRNLCGEIRSVQAATSNAVRNFPVEDTAAIILHFANGALGTLSISDVAAAPWSWEMTAGENKMYPRAAQSCYFIAGTDGALSVPQLEFWHYKTRPHWGEPFAVEKIVAPEQDPLVLQLRHFCEVVRGHAVPLLDSRGGTKTLEATLAVLTAAQSDAAVFLS
jgi:predicted dehydrogenase